MNDKLKGEFEAAVAAMEKDESIGASPDKLAAKICSIIAGNQNRGIVT